MKVVLSLLFLCNFSSVEEGIKERPTYFYGKYSRFIKTKLLDKIWLSI